jgi:hypothetical protein
MKAVVASQVSVVTEEDVWGLWSLYKENIDRCSMTSTFWGTDKPRRVKYKVLQDWMHRYTRHHRNRDLIVGDRFKQPMYSLSDRPRTLVYK